MCRLGDRPFYKRNKLKTCRNINLSPKNEQIESTQMYATIQTEATHLIVTCRCHTVLYHGFVIHLIRCMHPIRLPKPTVDNRKFIVVSLVDAILLSCRCIYFYYSLLIETASIKHSTWWLINKFIIRLEFQARSWYKSPKKSLTKQKKKKNDTKHDKHNFNQVSQSTDHWVPFVWKSVFTIVTLFPFQSDVSTKCDYFFIQLLSTLTPNTRNEYVCLLFPCVSHFMHPPNKKKGRERGTKAHNSWIHVSFWMRHGGCTLRLVFFSASMPRGLELP